MSAPDTAISPDARGIWQLTRGPLAIVVLIIVVGVAVALLQGSSQSGYLDPESAEPGGSRALSQLLAAEGVTVKRVQTANDAKANGGTVLVTTPDWVDPERLTALAIGADELVLVGPGQLTLDALLPAATVSGSGEVEEREPGCEFEHAEVAGAVTIGGIGYDAPEATATCYPTGEGYALLRVERFGSTITVLGSGAPLTNEALDEHGNAALAMRLLGAERRLTWYLPSLADRAPGEQSLVDLLPSGWKFGLVQVGIAVVLLALWRVRRLGPVVSEPLPVMVHAAETTEGRALLYRRAGAADHAAAALREAAAGRITVALGLPSDAGPEAVAASAAARTGRRPEAVYGLLYGPPPRDDTALVRLAEDLDTLENEVRAG